MRGVRNYTKEWVDGSYGHAVINYTLDDDGIINLMEAVLRKAGQDYYNEIPIDGNLTPEQVKIEKFIRTIYGNKKGQGIIDTLRWTHPLLKEENDNG